MDAIFKNIIITEVCQPFTVFSKNGRTSLMKNRSSYGISFCLSGQITYNLNGIKTVSHKNNAILLPKDASYSLHGDKEGLFPLINFQCEGLNQNSFLSFKLENPQEYIDLYEKMCICWSKGDKLSVFSIFYQLLSLLEQETNPKPSILTKANIIIHSSLSDTSLSNQVIAEQLKISEVYLRKLFSEHYGITPKQHIIGLRIELAKQMLTNTADTVTAISEKCGFTTVYHFCRIFKEKTGKTPKQYAKLNRIYKI